MQRDGNGTVVFYRDPQLTFFLGEIRVRGELDNPQIRVVRFPLQVPGDMINGLSEKGCPRSEHTERTECQYRNPNDFPLH